MSSSSINFRKIDDKFLKDNFWRNAFDQHAPFYESYVKYFKNGIVSGTPEIIDIHREAIYYTKDHALGSIIIRLMQISARYPESSFIETLAFFLSRGHQQERLFTVFSSISRQSIEKLIADINSVCSYLASTGDDDIVDELFRFRNVLYQIDA